MNPRNLQHQASAIRHLLNGGERTDEIVACVEGGIKALEYMHGGAADVLKWVITLKKENPSLYAALIELIKMGAKLDAIREAA
jgi:hypothetical protein